MVVKLFPGGAAIFFTAIETQPFQEMLRNQSKGYRPPKFSRGGAISRMGKDLRRSVSNSILPTCTTVF